MEAVTLTREDLWNYPKGTLDPAKGSEGFEEVGGDCSRAASRQMSFPCNLVFQAVLEG